MTKQIKDMSELVAWDKVYLIQHNGVAKLAHWTPKNDNVFSTFDDEVCHHHDVSGIIELCESVWEN